MGIYKCKSMYIWLMKIGLYIIFGSNVCFVGEKYCRESKVGSYLFRWIDSLFEWINILLGRNDTLLGWNSRLLGWNLMLLGWLPMLLGWINTHFGCIDTVMPDISRPYRDFCERWCCFLPIWYLLVHNMAGKSRGRDIGRIKYPQKHSEQSHQGIQPDFLKKLLVNSKLRLQWTRN